MCVEAALVDTRGGTMVWWYGTVVGMGWIDRLIENSIRLDHGSVGRMELDWRACLCVCRLRLESSWLPHGDRA